MKILAIDDNSANLVALQAVVRDALPGCVLLTALSGPQGIELARREDPDVILLDIVMPGMDGYEVCRRLKADEQLRSIPVVFVTALRTDREGRIKALDSGVEGFLPKPVDEQELIAEVRAMAKIKAANRQQRMEREELTALVAEHTRALEKELTERRRADVALQANESRMRDIMSSIADWVWETDEKGVYTYSSLQGSDLLGRTSEEIIGKTPFDFMPPDEAKRVEAIFSELVAHKAPIKDLENWNLSKNGEQICLLTSGMPILDEAGNLRGYRGVDKDISQRKLAEEHLRASERKRRRLFETMSEGAFYQLADGTLVDVNSAALRMFGLSEDEFLSRTSMHSEWDVIREDGTPLPGHEHPSMQALSTGKPVQDLVVGILNPQTKAYTWVSASAIPEFREGQDTPYQVVMTMHDITARKCAEEALRQAQAILQAAMNQSTAGIAIADAPSGNLRYVNDAGLLIRGGTRETVVNGIGINEYVASWNILDLDGRPLETDDIPLARAVRFGETCSREFIIRRTADDDRVVSANAAPIRDESGKVVAGIVVFLDITESRRAAVEKEALQTQLAQSQKLESVGRLAGGVAHDFNNMLMGIMNYVQLCRDEIGEDHPIRSWLDEITIDAERSTKLTRQLLAFARKQVVAPKVLDLNDAVASMLKMLQRLIGEDIRITWQPGTNIGPVKIDPVQIDQILANLAVNARDAIGGVGSVAIETSGATLDEAFCADHPESTPGDYNVLAITDDGCGMDGGMLRNIFEPFFTTKGDGEGTGLGLATVYGIVKQNAGFIDVYSEPGKGTTFRIYLPRFHGAETTLAADVTPSRPPRGDETVLLVEDEKSIRVTVRLFLEDLGYTVLAADCPGEAVRLAAEHSGEIHLLITDVVMPGMSGRDLARQLATDRPGMRRLFISGYTANVIAHRGVLDEGVNFLSKPFGRDALARKVREVLDT